MAALNTITYLDLVVRRRSKAGSEQYERETALGSPSMTPRNVTPLVPLTPLRWKSSPEEQSEKAGPVDRSRLGLRVTNSGDNLQSQGHSEEEQKEEDDDEPTDKEEQKEEQKGHVHTMPFEGFYSKPQSTAVEDDGEEDDDEADEGDESSATGSPSRQDM